MVDDAKPALVFVHGINSGPAEREAMPARVEAFLSDAGVRDLFGRVQVAAWRSLGDFVGDLEDLGRHVVRREEAVSDVSKAISDACFREASAGAYDGRRHSAVVVGHSMGQPLAACALRELAKGRPHPVPVRLLTLGGPLGNGLVRAYFHWVDQNLWGSPARETLGVECWNDVWNPDDPVCGGPFYRAFLAAQPHRLDLPGHPDPLHLFAEHGSYFTAPLVFDVLRSMVPPA